MILKMYISCLFGFLFNDAHIAQFNNKPGSKGPFYVWKNAEICDKMLTAGKKVHLFADLSESSEQNAIKFSRIAMNILSHNVTIKVQLNQALAFFSYVNDSF